MVKKGWIKRLLPFVATFAIGVFIASFFVDLSRPRMGFRGPGRRWQEMQRMRFENEELKNENLRLRNEMENMRWEPQHSGDVLEIPKPGLDEWSVPPPPPPPVKLGQRVIR
jgi:hypothetical protein